MAEQLEIDGKVYEPSTALAGAFGYTADYVSKLARDGKVIAQQVGRQWYVDRNSLTAFSHQASKQKISRKESLRKERKLERAAQRGITEVTYPPLPHPSKAFARAVTVFTVVAIAACTSLVALDEGVGLDDVNDGARAVLTDVLSLGDTIDTAGTSQVGLLSWFKRQWMTEETFVTEEMVRTEKTEPHDAVSRRDAGLVLLEPGTDDEVVDSVRAMFSDPVEVDFESEDSGLIKPIFEEETGESYRFLLVPVERKKE